MMWNGVLCVHAQDDPGGISRAYARIDRNDCGGRGVLRQQGANDARRQRHDRQAAQHPRDAGGAVNGGRRPIATTDHHHDSADDHADHAAHEAAPLHPADEHVGGLLEPGRGLWRWVGDLGDYGIEPYGYLGCNCLIHVFLFCVLGMPGNLVNITVE